MRLSAALVALASFASHAELCDTRIDPAVPDDIRARGEIRIGTTGDYAPFSFLAGDERRGIDVEIGSRLARDLGVRLTWVTTSWPTLVADLDAGRFDVAISGISVTDERRAHGCFTDAYVATGKTVLARCISAERFTSLEAIDREGVRVIVNPGGTNARFVDANITHATIVRHAENVTIFAALAEGAADLMITDAVEAAQVARADPRLCAPIPNTFFERVSKAFYVPARAAWRNWLQEWLEARRDDGMLAETLAHYDLTPAASAVP